MAEDPNQATASVSSKDTAGKPAILIVGGLGLFMETLSNLSTSNGALYTGYIGRFIALHIHQNNLASEVRLIDKVLPQLARLAPEFSGACSKDKFMQADASRERT